MSGFELKTEGGKTLLKNGSNMWTAPIIEEKTGKFFKSHREYADKYDLSEKTVSSRVTTGNGLRPATKDEAFMAMTIATAKAYRVVDGQLGVEVMGDSGKWVKTELTEGQAKVRGIKRLFTDNDPPAKAGKAPVVATETFTIVVWPDGAVTARVNGNKDFSMTRAALTDIPEEIRKSARIVNA